MAVNGSLRLSREGILLSGLTHSSIFPERLFNGEARLEAFLPLDGNLWDAYIAAGGYADLPSLAWQHGGEERLTLSTLQPHIATLLAQSAHIAERTQPFFVVVTDTANDAVVHAVRGLQVAGATVGDGYAWAVDTVIDGVVDGTTGTVAAAKAGFHSARGLATASYQWSATLVTNGAAATADAGYNSYVWTITRLDNSATAVSDAALSGYQATQAFAVGSYVWTVERSSAGAATVGTWTEGGYRVVADGVAAGLEVVGEWLWPPAWWGK